MKKPKVLIPIGMGLNCEEETQKAFQLSGALTEKIFIGDLVKSPKKLLKFDLLCFIGGFSFGDHLGAGTVLANKFKFHLKDELKEFIKRGKLILGICNGFQVMTRLGLFALSVPLFEQEFSLNHNDSYQFRDAWVSLKVNESSPCIFTQGLTFLDLPIRHGEGKFSSINERALRELKYADGVVLQYANSKTRAIAEKFPANPNGSFESIAGICDRTGRIFALMPHPEAYISPLNHPQWMEQKKQGILPKQGEGLSIFKNSMEFIKQNL